MAKTVCFLSILLTAFMLGQFIPFEVMGLGIFGFFCAVFVEYFGWKKMLAVYFGLKTVLLAFNHQYVVNLVRSGLDSVFAATLWAASVNDEAIVVSFSDWQTVMFAFGFVALTFLWFLGSMFVCHRLLHRLGFFNRIDFGGYRR